MAITIAGLDPSLRNLGMAKGKLCLDTGDFKLTDLLLIETSVSKDQKTVRKNSQDLERARLLYNGLHTFIQGIDIVCVEIPVGSQSARAMLSVGVCIGVLASISTPLVQVTPREVKLAAVQSKTATKQEMINWAVETYPYAKWLTKKTGGVITPIAKNEHLADAVASIHAGVKTDQFNLMKILLRK